MSIMSGLKSLINKKAAMRTAVGVAATVSAASIVNDSMGIMEASHTVEHHAKTINGHANLAARILEIDRNQLVNTNYLRLASTIDDYLTGRTDELHIDPSMFGTAEAVTAESQPDLDPRAAEAAKNITGMIQSSLESEKDDNVSESPTNVVDFTSLIKAAASEDVSKILNSEKSHIEKSSNIAPPKTTTAKEADKEVKEVKEVKYIKETKDVKEVKEVKDVKDVPEIKEASKIEDVKRHDEDHLDEAVDTDLKKAAKIEDKKSVDTSGLLDALNESRAESIEKSNDQEYVSEIDNNKVEDHSTDQQAEHVTQSEENRIEESPKSETVEEIKSDQSEIATSTSEPSQDSKDLETEVHGSMKIDIAVEYANHHRLADFVVIKETTGVRKSDGSIEWSPVEFTKDDLPADFKKSDLLKRAEFVNPEFKATYLPSEERSVVQDKLTMRSLAGKKKESDKISSRKIILKSENGEVLQEINQDSNAKTISIPREIGRFYTDIENVDYEDKDIEIVYQERYQEVSEIVDYNVKDVDEEDNVINEYKKSVSIVKQIDKSKNMVLSTNEEEAANSLDQEDLDGYEKVDRIIDYSNRSIIRKFRKVVSIDHVVEPDVDDIDSPLDLSAKRVKEVSDQKLSSIPTLSNRAEYSKYTSINDFDSDLLDRNIISDLVFELSDGTYSEQDSDKILRPSRYSTKLVELNNRFTDRMIERINDFRRSLGLREVSKQPLTLAQERMYASHVIYNYLANDHSSSKINDIYKGELNVLRRESMQPVHKLKTASQYLTPEAVADSMFRSILNESTSYLTQDGGETGHLEQLIDPEVKTVYAGMFVGDYLKTEQQIQMADRIVSAGSLNDYSISTTLQYYK